MNLLVLDIGTTSIRGILFDAQGHMLHLERRHDPLIYENGYIEQEASVYANSVTEICRAICSRFSVDGIALTAFRSSPVLLDESGTLLSRFIMWQDVRNQGIVDRLVERSEWVRQRCGAKINTVFTATKLTWYKENLPQVWAAAKKAMVVPDYLLYTMTGAVVTDRTYGSRTLLMNLASGQWDDALCGLFSIEKDKLCTLIEVGEVAGQVSEAFAAATGLTVGTPVVTAGGDQQCAALGLGVFGSSAVAINCGTGAYAIGVSDVPILDNPKIICNRAAIPGKYIVEASVSRCATALNAFIAQTYPEFGGDMERLNHEVEFGTDQRAKQARALYESVAVGIADCVASIPHGDQITCYLSGGVSNSVIFNRILAKAVGHPLIRWSDPEATAIGAFISGAVALGVYPDYEAAFQAARAEDVKAVYLP